MEKTVRIRKLDICDNKYRCKQFVDTMVLGNPEGDSPARQEVYTRDGTSVGTIRSWYMEFTPGEEVTVLLEGVDF